MIRFSSFSVTLFFLAWGTSWVPCSPVRVSQIPEIAESPVPENSRQLILVLTDDWKDQSGSLWLFERSESTLDWEPVRNPLPVVVGRSGLGWGRGLHPVMNRGPVKQEGDGRAPAGVFHLGAAFGYEPPDRTITLRTDYIHAGVTVQCVDDPDSRYYNQVLDSLSADTVDWTSYEHMRRRDDQYKIGLVVEHNVTPVVPGAGSCIFLHIWSQPEFPTSGCTAMDASNMERLVAWIRSQDHPVLVQLPRSEYDRLQKSWKLPEITQNSLR